MDVLDQYVSTELDRMTMEVLVRSYFDTLNERGDPTNYLSDSVVFRPSLSRSARGRSEVIEMIESMQDAFEECETEIVSLATGEGFVLAECVLHLKLRGSARGRVLAFSYIRINDGRISEWHQLTGAC